MPELTSGNDIAEWQSETRFVRDCEEKVSLDFRRETISNKKYPSGHADSNDLRRCS